MSIKKWLSRGGVGLATAAIVAAGAAGLVAFEGHVINVTATIENALNVPVRALDFGTVFPQEKLDQQFSVFLSQSFQDEDRVDDVEYFIRQKPKCANDPLNPTEFSQVTEDEQGNFHCVNTAHQMLPLLCPYLSKTELTTDGLEKENDGPGISAFHGPITLAAWTLPVSQQFDVNGRLVKSGQDIEDTWNIDLKVPCFGNHCAQDWESFVLGINPTASPASYIQPIADEHKVYGCDLWLEVSEISIPNGKASLTVIKHVENNSGTGTSVASDFTINVTGTTSTPVSFPGEEAGTWVVLDPGNYSVNETGPSGYTQTLSTDCSGTIVAGDHKTCTITNDDIPVTTGSLTVNKVVIGSNADPNSFALFVDGFSVTNGVATTTSAGDHTVSETPNSDYTTTFSGGCDPNTHVVNVPVGGNATCTVTNTLNDGTITVIKEVVNHVPGTTVQAGNFQMKIDGNDVAQNTPVGVSANVAHTISETGPVGYTTTFSGDCDGTNQVTVTPGQDATCTVTNEQLFGTITVTKTVDNTDGGTKQIANFGLKVGVTTVTSGVARNFVPGVYTVSETGAIGYAATFSGDCDNGGHAVSIAAGESKSCGILNDDIKPVISLVKIVNGGTAEPEDFFMRVNGISVPHSSSIQVTANADHTISEDAFPGYTFSGIAGAGCPATLPGVVNLPPGASIVCEITNDANP